MMNSEPGSNAGMFHQLRQLMGKKVEVAIISTGKRLEGVVSYIMPDSFLLETDKVRLAIAYKDLVFINPL